MAASELLSIFTEQLILEDTRQGSEYEFVVVG